MRVAIVFFSCFLFFTAGLAQERRLALIIANSAYPGNALKNPVNDATLMEATLKKLDFTVIKRTNANKKQMEEAVKLFSERLPEYNVALFFYAGHGMQASGVNYLIPIDAKLEKESDLKFEALSVNFIVEEFELYPKNTNIVILDACRDNPLVSWQRGGSRGFKAISPRSGTIIAFATAEGSTASDGAGANGLFTAKLVEQMAVDQPIEAVFKNTRIEVVKASQRKQCPQEWSMLTGNFNFVKTASSEQAVALQPEAKVEEIPSRSMGGNDVTITEESLKGKIRIVTDIEGTFTLDGVAKGKFSKGKVYTLDNIPVGSHELTIGSWKKTVVVEENKIASVSTSEKRNLETKTQPSTANANASLPERKSAPAKVLDETLTDSRDNKTYRVVSIGNLMWMAENLSYAAEGSWNWYYSAGVGRYYKYEVAKDACPVGWRLPTLAEVNGMIEMLEGSGLKAKALGGRNAYKRLMEMNFSDPKSGIGLSDGKTPFKGKDSYFWTSDGYKGKDAGYALFLNDGNAETIVKNRQHGLTVRCVKDKE